MRSARPLGGAVLLAMLALSVACDTTPPQQLDSQTATLRILATGSVRLLNVWNTFEDLDNDSIYDEDTEGPLFLYCEATRSGGSTAPVFGAANSLPWPFFTRVTVLRDGQTEWEDVTIPDAAIISGFNLTDFDDSQRALGGGPRKAGGATSITADNRVFRFRNPRILTTVNADVIRALEGTSRVCQAIGQDPAIENCTLFEGICSNTPTAIRPLIGGQPQPLGVQLGKGDLIRVELGRSFTPQQQLASLMTQVIAPGYSAQLFVNGRRVNVEGDASLDPTTGDTSFVFTYRSR